MEYSSGAFVKVCGCIVDAIMFILKKDLWQFWCILMWNYRFFYFVKLLLKKCQESSYVDVRCCQLLPRLCHWDRLFLYIHPMNSVISCQCHGSGFIDNNPHVSLFCSCFSVAWIYCPEIKLNKKKVMLLP